MHSSLIQLWDGPEQGREKLHGQSLGVLMQNSAEAPTNLKWCSCWTATVKKGPLLLQLLHTSVLELYLTCIVVSSLPSDPSVRADFPCGFSPRDANENPKSLELRCFVYIVSSPLET